MRSVKVSDYMTDYVMTFAPDTDLFKAIGTMLDRKISGAPVVNSDGVVVGTLSEWDCLQRILQGSYYEEVGGKVGDYMKTDFLTIGPNDDIVDVADSMTKQNWHRSIPVLDGGKLVGILSCPDILKVIYDFDVHTAEGAHGRA